MAQRPSSTRSGRRPGFWQILFGRAVIKVAPPALPPPLFPARPVSPPPPKGPGLPAWDEILSAAPPVPDPGPGAAAPPHLQVVPRPSPAPAPPAPPSAPAIGEAAPLTGNKRPPTEDEQRALAQLGALLGAGQIAQAAELLDAVFRARPDACDARGRPIYLLESLHVALLLGDTAAAADRARRLRPHLPPDDAVVESLYARAAVATGNRGAARAHWMAALARAPDLAEARAWLAAHPVSQFGGSAVLDLLGPLARSLGPAIQPPPSLAPPPAAAPEVPDWLPARWLPGAAVSVAADGSAQAVADAEAAGPAAGDGPHELALVFRHPDGLGSAHAFAELLLAAFVVQRRFLGHLRPARVYVGRQGWALPAAADSTLAVAPQIEMLAVLFPGVRVFGDYDGALPEPQALVVDGALRNAATGTLIGAMMPWVTQCAAEARARVHAACGLPAAAEPPRDPARRPHVLYLHAAPPRTLAEPVRERLFALFTTAGFDVALADIATLPWHRQVRLAYGADIITGAHGPGFSVVLWANARTRVLEFFPEGMRRYDAQLLAEAAGLPYLGLEGVAERGFVGHARERWGPPVGRANRLVWALPWNLLEQAFAAR